MLSCIYWKQNKLKLPARHIYVLVSAFILVFCLYLYSWYNPASEIAPLLHVYRFDLILTLLGSNMHLFNNIYIRVTNELLLIDLEESTSEALKGDTRMLVGGAKPS
jgi:hypothetical protein